MAPRANWKGYLRLSLRAGLMSERDYDKRRCTRDVARKIRDRDDLSTHRV